MSGLLLTDAERVRFIEYLRLEISNHAGVLKLMEEKGLPAMLIQREKMLHGAKIVVLRDLESVETYTVGGER